MLLSDVVGKVNNLIAYRDGNSDPRHRTRSDFNSMAKKEHYRSDRSKSEYVSVKNNKSSGRRGNGDKQ